MCGPCRGYTTRTSCYHRGVLRQQLEDEEFGVRWPSACEVVNLGAGERPPVKTQQTGDLVCAVVNGRVCELTITLYVTLQLRSVSVQLTQLPIQLSSVVTLLRDNAVR
jgi:hypothetical protein